MTWLLHRSCIKCGRVFTVIRPQEPAQTLCQLCQDRKRKAARRAQA